MLYRYQTIRELHLELSSFCNARCPMCARTKNGKVSPQLKQGAISFVEAQRFFPKDLLARLDTIFVCGSFGDPSLAPDCLEIMEYLRSQAPTARIFFYTNGGTKDPAFWRRLAPLVSVCKFGVDGLEDTNHLYRVGVQWKKLLQNMNAFIKAGGVAGVNFLVFAHNEHQVEDAADFFLSLGAKTFVAHATERFERWNEGVKRWPVYRPDGTLSHFLEETKLQEYADPARRYISFREGEKPNDIPPNVKPYLAPGAESCDIACPSSRSQSIYVSAEGYVWPCCFTAQEMYADISERKLEIPGGVESLSLRHRSWQEILGSELYQNWLVEKWQKRTVEEGKPEICSRLCKKT